VEAELASLAASGATTLVGLMVSETWTQARDRVARSFARGEGCRQCGVQAALAGRLHQQDRPGLRDHRATVALNADRRVRPSTLLHLESAAFLTTTRTFDKPYRPSPEALSVFLISLRTALLVKARG
jgi:hypothetical protein